MANNYRSPWVLDTASATAVKPNFVKVAGMQFIGYAAAGHKATIKDARGLIVAQMVGVADLSPVNAWTGEEHIVNGFTLAVLDSGKVVVEVV